jgi:hypothetical protein
MFSAEAIFEFENQAAASTWAIVPWSRKHCWGNRGRVPRIDQTKPDNSKSY